MSRRDKTIGKAAKLQRRKRVMRHNALKAPSRRKPLATDPYEKIALLERRLNEALEQQTASSEILSVISRSAADVQPVLNAIVRTAVTLCASYDAVILLRDGEELRIAAHHGPMPLDFDRLPLARDLVAGRTVLDRVPVHVHDLTTEAEEFPRGREIGIRLNQRTVLGLPLLR